MSESFVKLPLVKIQLRAYLAWEGLALLFDPAQIPELRRTALPGSADFNRFGGAPTGSRQFFGIIEA